MRRPPANEFLLVGLLTALVVGLTPSAIAEESRTPAARAVVDLGQELGVLIRLKGGEGRTVSLPASELKGEARIAELASALSGSWRRTLRLTEKGPSRAPESAELERLVTLGFSDLPASKALAIIARQLGAEWDPAQAPTRRVTLPGVSRTVRALLDEITRQVGVSWTIEYRIDAPDAEVIRVLTQPETPRPRPTPAPVEPKPDLQVAVVRMAPSPEVWSKSLKESLLRLLKSSPDRRSAALDLFLKEVAEAAGSIRSIRSEQRFGYRSAGAKLLDQWTRLYRGLAPTVRDELEVADFVLRDLLGG